MDKIIVKGAREHNLKNITVEIPRDKLVVITGLSGSGKSTLAFDTIYSEGQRRYVESLSSYARQFLGNINKPDVDSIDGLSPAVSIEQKTTSKNPRSTVGTVTEIYDYLRILYARVASAHCPKCNTKIEPQSLDNIVNLILSERDKKIIILAPKIEGQKGTYEKLFDELKKDGFSKVMVDGTIYDLDTINDQIKLKRYERHWIDVVIDRLKTSEDIRSRITDSVEQALIIGKDKLKILDYDEYKNKRDELGESLSEKEFKDLQKDTMTTYSTFGACPNHPEIIFEEPEPRQFSFNSPFGACPNCLGIGRVQTLDIDLIIPDKTLSIANGAVKVWKKRIDLGWRIRELKDFFKKYGVDMFTPIEKFPKKAFESLINGDLDSSKPTFEGIIPQTLRLYKNTDSEKRKLFFETFMTFEECNLCHGKRLKENILSFKINNFSIIDITDLNVEKALEFFENLTKNDILSKKQKIIANQVLKEIVNRLSFLKDVGLGYLTLSRSASTLSGGEAQRIRLATQIGANLMGVLYVLDEPSIGLHQRDNDKLIATLKKLRDVGNSLIVVEHDEDTIREADYVIDMGPGAGVNGGHIVATGTPKQIEKNKNSITGAYLRGDKKIEIPKKKRDVENFITLYGAKENNLKIEKVKFPTGVLCAITGVSGSGKSTLLNQTLQPILKKHFGYQVDGKPGKYEGVKIPDELTDIIVIDQSPIGKTPRSNPATYIKVFDEIRKLFANTKEAKKRGYKEGRFSFNVKGGRCEACKGEGIVKIEMNFLPDVYVECEVCHGKRYNKETLEVLYQGKNIADILEMSVDQAVEFFKNHSSIYRKLKTLQDVGLGYIKLGQSSTTLSGGEAQRIKLTKELSKYKKGHIVYILDEPTTGLHFEDVNKLLEVLNRLVDKKNTIYVIEHNLDVIKTADYIIDLGPEGGDGGGKVIAFGRVEDIIKNEKSHTGRFLKKLLENEKNKKE